MPDLSPTLATPDGLVTVEGAPPPRRRWWQRRRPADPSDARYRAFLAEHWVALSAAAYRGFRRHGAGAVALAVDVATPRPDRLAYVTQVHTLPGATEADFDGWAARALETYDPEQEALVVFAEPRRIVGYLVRGTTPPAEAMRRAAASGN